MSKRGNAASVSRITIITYLVLTVLPTFAHADPLLTLVEFRWTNHVTAAQCGDTYDGTAPLQPLYLWMRVRGGREAFSQLKADGKLPIRHRWFKVVGTKVRYEQSTDAINLDVGSDATLQPLLTALAAHGSFDWRTWSMKEHVSSGSWLVRLEYAKGDPVLCGDDHHPCEFEIEIE